MEFIFVLVYFVTGIALFVFILSQPVTALVKEYHDLADCI